MTLGSLEYHGHVLGFKFKPAKLIRIQSRVESVLVNLELIDEVASLGLIRSEIDEDHGFAHSFLHEFHVTYV
jgi:hypothetical protein